MANPKKILLSSGLVIAGICAANANTLFQTNELGNTANIQANLLNIEAKDAEAFRFSDLCCGYGAHLTPKQTRQEARLTKKEQKKYDRALHIAARKEAKNKQKDAVAKQ